MSYFYFSFRKAVVRFPPLYFVLNAISWLPIAIIGHGISAAVAISIVLNVSLLASLIIYTNAFNKSKPIEILNEQSPFLNNAKNYGSKVFLSLAPLLCLLSVYIYTAALFLVILMYIWEYTLLASGAIRDRKNVTSEILKYNPVVCAFVSGSAESAYQINMWLNVLERLPHKTIILITERDIYLGMRETILPVVFVSNIDEIFSVFECGIRCVLYPANGQKNAQAFRYSAANHCFINHGESDKGVNQSKFLMAYDKLFLAGPRALDRMLEANLPVRDDQVEFVGRPQLEMELEKRERVEIKKLLYAPTWEGFVSSEDYTSIDTIGLSVIESLHKSGYDIVFRPHPFIGRRRASARKELQKTLSYCAANGIEVSLNESETIYQAMNRCDLMLSDISSTLIDFLFTNKPMILCLGREPSNVRIQEMESLSATYKLDRGADVTHLIEAIKRDDFLMAARNETTKSYLYEGGVGSFDAFVRSVGKCV